MKTRVYIRYTEYANTVEFAIVRSGGNDPGDRTYIAKPVKLEFKEIKAGEIPPPTLVLRGLVAQDVMQSLAEALDKKGFKTDKDAKIEGTLVATRYHLEDLRKLLNLEKKNA